MKTLTYASRMQLLRKKKIQHTLQKRKQQGYTDADDYGTVPLPDSFQFVPTPSHPDGSIFGAKACAANFAALLRAHPVYVDPLEMLCGRWRKMLTEYRALGSLWDEEHFPYEALKPAQQHYGIVSGIESDAHCAPDYSIGLALGFGGLLEKVRRHRAENPDQEEFYTAEETVLLAMQQFIRRHIAEITRQLEEPQPSELRQSLKAMLAANRNLVDEPPKTFLEACQWIAWYNVFSRIYNRDGAGCQLDLLLSPYYERDVAAGWLDDDTARFVLANLLLIDTHYYQLSGRDEEGNDQTCKLSWLILEAAHTLNSSANLTVRVHPATNPAYLQKAVEYLFLDRNGWPRFCGDTPLVEGYMRNGYSSKTARRRIAVGCNWMAVPGEEYPMNDCVKINIARVFEVAFLDMMQGNQPHSTSTLMALFETHLAQAAQIVAAGINLHLDHQHKVAPELVINLLMRDTLEKGQDITQCARLQTIGVDGAGLAIVADSFAALQQRIEQENRLTWPQVAAALASNFAQDEHTRLMLAASARYCGGETLADGWAQKITQSFAHILTTTPMPKGRKLIPGWFSWSNTISLGRGVGATPNGRRAGTPISHGANPNPGFRKDGAATAQSTGIARVQPGYGNTAPLQLEFDPKLSLEEGGAQRVAALIKTHFQLGGTLININVLDKERLLAAHKNPEAYPELVVRVTGFTAYFVSLSPEFRGLVVERFVEGF